MSPHKAWLGESSLDFTRICQVGEFVDHSLAQYELRKHTFRRFREEGIESPFPQRVVHVRGGDGAREVPPRQGAGVPREGAL